MSDNEENTVAIEEKTYDLSKWSEIICKRSVVPR